MTLTDLTALTKFTISAFSTLSAGAGFAAARHRHPGSFLALLPLLGGTLLLAMAASTLNEIQERDLDARMDRTRHRPVARGALGVGPALALAGLLGAVGTGTLLAGCGPGPCLLGLLALAWYILVYTPLKRITALAVLPGSLIGALPPAMGWAAAGGSLGDPGLAAIMLVFFLWQIPHFWLLALLHRNDYAGTGLPTLSLPPADLGRATLAWIAATTAGCALLPATGAVQQSGSRALLAAATLLWLVRGLALLGSGPAPYRRAFLDTNRFILALMVALVLG